jgi:uncharacterized protein (TIGR03435 family)
MKLSILVAPLFLLASAEAAPLAQQPELEVASIRLVPDERLAFTVMEGGPGTATPERIHYKGVSLMNLVTEAFGLYSDQVFGPRWLINDQYVLDAIVPKGTTVPQFEVMLQNFLARRFGLTAHEEERDFVTYSLVVAPGGPHLRNSAQANTANGEGAFVELPLRPEKVDAEGCPVTPPGSHGAVGSVGRTSCMAYRGYSMADFIPKLEMMVAVENGSYFGPQASSAHVTDRTGLAGTYDFNFTFNMGAHVRRYMPEFPQFGDDEGPSLSDALKKELGLALVKSKSRLPCLVIDGINRVPTEN